MTWQNFNLAVADVARQPGQAEKLEFSAEKGMRGVSDGYSAFAFLSDKGGIVLVEVSPYR